MAALRRRYQNDPGFRQMVQDFNAMQGHPNRGEAASLQALDELAVAGAPASALITAIQPRPSFLRALQRHWQRQRPPDSTTR